MRRLAFYMACLLSLPASVLADAACPPREDYVSITKRPANALLYRIEHCEHPDSHVFGTFHSDSPDLEPIVHDVKQVLTKSDQLALELKLEDSARQKARSWLMLPPDHPGLKAMLGQERFTEIVNAFGPILQAGANTLNRYRPWAVAVLVQYPPPEADGVVVDEQLQRFAQQLGRRIFGLESLEEQFHVFDRMPRDDQIDFLLSTLETVDQLEVMHTELKMHYMAQHLPAIEQMSDDMFATMAEDHPALAEYLETHILDKRNRTMTERVLPALEQSTLVAVGALHLPGEDGMLHLLEQAGWYIYPVKP